MGTFSSRVIQFNKALSYTGMLPKGIEIMNPFKEKKEIDSIAQAFYNKFYSDNLKRKMILGINPGRLGAGATGIPFTDTKRLWEICGIQIKSMATHEPSSVFIYELIKKYGGAEKFYSNYYINSMCPLGFITLNRKGNWVNCNYYDDEELFSSVYNFMIESLKTQINFGIDRETCIVLGKKNGEYFKAINDREKLFDSIVVLEHPRYIVQYKAKDMDQYLETYLKKLNK